MSTSLTNRELEYKQLNKRRRIEFTLGRKAQNATLQGTVSSKQLEHSSSHPVKGTSKDSLFDSSIVEQHLQWKKIQRVGPGFYNEGNTCFLNSTLQCLLYIPAFIQVLLSESAETLRRLQKGESNMKPILELFTILAREVWQNQHGQAISPKGLVTSIRRVGKQFKPFRQEDAHEYMRQLIDTMNEEILKSHNLKLSDGKITQTTMISRVFGGNLCNILSCPKCSYQSKTFNHFQDLSLDINKQGINSVDAAIKSFTTVEYLSQGNEWKCEKCKQKVKVSIAFLTFSHFFRFT
jgi:ubiquitin carboxyl-terminal hydrolase 36/42